ncbi:capsular biosynthesis protein [Stenotrophomonas maltophilia]|uniref:SGNH/GDSL hydrolase family protein n=1 Tax=Stenotrophomonas TaxID=40323 RepID=UPI00131078CA|nr:MULTISPECIES: SGNH/GDSL hydrolase family protein [Stenotrophomonas]ELC7322099.1 SGNH/GDSL hydrolase family protein [Stenotrophomonas maltophilia]MBA0276146.1 capsular biosynthesis protein [Stenotrophomonas maltophilia]MBA0411345.1 capsular biosynthesis protein [Stenotrophomonas maltophilia]MBA0496448.1 capsular biosynthesis protein [Stenotrophomonas maltophilia]MBA0500558.1 capsular biosynthesis protein [Stenotrophomonas maltophilia]
MRIPVVLASVAAMVLGIALTAPAVAAETSAVNPLLQTPIEQLRPDEVRFMQERLADWPELQRYRDANARLPDAVPGQPRVVFFGDSITEGWGREGSAGFFPGKGWLNRGISGQTTAQMLVRFPQDVLALKPQVVVILAGTNDIAGNTGPSTQAMIEDNLHAMVDLARAHGIAVVLASVLPVSDYPWLPGTAPAPKVRALNTALKRYADAQQLVYLDYYTPMANAAGGLDPQLADDGVHPTAKGYAVMAPLAQAAVKRALQQK